MRRLRRQLLVALVAGDIWGAWLFEMFLGWKMVMRVPKILKEVFLSKFQVDE